MKRAMWTVTCLLLIAAPGSFALAGEREIAERLGQREREIGKIEQELNRHRQERRRLEEEGADGAHIEKLGRGIHELEQQVARRMNEIETLRREREGGGEEQRDRKMQERREREQMAQRERPEREMERERREGTDPDDVAGFVKQNCPYFARKMQETRERAPEEFRDRMEDMERTVMEYNELRTHNPQAAELFLRRHKLEDRSHGLAEDMARTDSREKQEHLRMELNKTLNEAFEVMIRMGEVEIHQMEKEIQEIGGILEKKRQARERIIERRVRDLMREHSGEEEDVLDWW